MTVALGPLPGARCCPAARTAVAHARTHASRRQEESRRSRIVNPMLLEPLRAHLSPKGNNAVQYAIQDTAFNGSLEGLPRAPPAQHCRRSSPRPFARGEAA